MTLFKAALYGIVQGLTEFLPISSSAHLALFPWILGWEDPGLAFDVALHWGTLFAVTLYFRKDIVTLFAGWLGSFRGQREPMNTLPWKIILATIPAALAGLLLENKAETVFRSPVIISAALILFGLLLYAADKSRRDIQDLSKLKWTHSLWIGLAQSLAIIPGVSRSGITATAGLFLSLNRDAAVRYSFLLSMPIILGAGIKKVNYFAANLTNPSFLVGLSAATISGLAAIHFLLHFVKTKSFTIFVIYRVILGSVILLWYFTMSR